jgi:hypothetical protein
MLAKRVSRAAGRNTHSFCRTPPRPKGEAMKICLALFILLASVALAQDQPRVYLTSVSNARPWNAHRDPTICVAGRTEGQ